MHKKLQAFHNHYQKIAAANGIMQILVWDQETMMPEGATDQRAEQMAYLSAHQHALQTDKNYIETMNELLGAKDLGAVETAGIRKQLRDSETAVKLPSSLVEEIARASVVGQQSWKNARAKNDFKLFEKDLSTIIELKKKQGECLREDGQSVFEALLAEFEPDFPISKVNALFTDLKRDFVPLVKEIIKQNEPPKLSDAALKMPIEIQREMNKALASAIGFDMNKGRLDEAAHPFCSGVWNDVRMTTRYDVNDWTNSLYSVLHEAGHGMYEQGVGRALANKAAGSFTSLGMHESQSRFWENCIGRSLPFCNWVIKFAGAKYGVSGMTGEEMYKYLNSPEYSYIRVDSDEATYNLHIMVRFEIEEAIFAGKVAVADLPALWNQKYKEYLNLEPAGDAKGVLQDVHWSTGGLGYFPTYTLGNLISAQLLNAIRKDLDVDALVGRGEFQPIREWLYERIHSKGVQFSTLELVKMSTGEELTAKFFIDYMKRKFL